MYIKYYRMFDEEDRTQELYEKGGLDYGEARIIAKFENGKSAEEIKEELDFDTIWYVKKVKKDYLNITRKKAKWLINNGPSENNF